MTITLCASASERVVRPIQILALHKLVDTSELQRLQLGPAQMQLASFVGLDDFRGSRKMQVARETRVVREELACDAKANASHKSHHDMHKEHICCLGERFGRSSLRTPATRRQKEYQIGSRGMLQ